MEEKWIDIKGFEGKYQLSSKGRVLSLNYNNTHKPRILKPKVNRYGYNEIKLSKNNKTKNYLILTLVAEHFLKKPAADMIPIHLGKINDDSVENISYGYRSEMLHLTYKKGRRKGKPSENTVSYKGKQYKKISEIVKDYNIDIKNFDKRLKRGWTLEEALEIPIDRKQKILNVKLFKYRDKLYSVKALSELSGIDTKVIYKRLKRGWSVEETVEIPVGNFRKGEK